jgi:hypothetical protein
MDVDRGFRLMPIGDSGDVDQRFRMMPITKS